MPDIYLASRSKARRELLKSLGIKFKVIPVDIKEKSNPKYSSYARLVRHNALLKARAAGRRVESGVIIAADTLMVQDKIIFVKPKNLADARRMLKNLSAKPQTVYTGIALIDKDSGRESCDYEKTKVYMDKLSDNDIDNYFACVSPLGKAGSYDISGRGAFFIRRIEGCFYNVVGLPIRKLYRMLRKLDIKVFSFAICYMLYAIFLCGCSTEYNVATNKEETFFYTTEKEVAMGKAIDRQVLTQHKLTEDLLVQKRIEDIGRKIVAVCDRKDIDYHFKVLEDDEVNAVSLPGGFVYVNSGLVKRAANDDELAAVLAHEVGHIVARHSIKKLQGMMGYTLLRLLTLAAPSGGGAVGGAADAAFNELMLGYSREDEFLADQMSVRYTKLAGYNPHAMIDFLKKLKESDRRKPLRQINYFKTHPYVPDRIRVVKQALGESIGFSDYINTEQQPHD
ncbi:MAG: Maf and M48 domain-containing protein [Candidatus Omnitrophica bacterium]|nr:Maf and M48 domain-containing protein [Candidatus Omnitrophota bacterium]